MFYFPYVHPCPFSLKGCIKATFILCTDGMSCLLGLGNLKKSFYLHASALMDLNRSIWICWVTRAVTGNPFLVTGKWHGPFKGRGFVATSKAVVKERPCGANQLTRESLVLQGRA